MIKLTVKCKDDKKLQSWDGYMNKLLDKLVLLTLCLAVYLMHDHGIYVVVPVIIAVLASAGSTCFRDKRAKVICFAAYTAACLFMSPLLIFLPELCYDLPVEEWKWLFAVTVPVCAAFLHGQSYIGIFASLLIATSLLMSYRTDTIAKSTREYIGLRDSAKELSLRLEGKNRELLQKQDYEINLATLRERNRIARDIHDSVGHVLSSSILQVGAIMATCSDSSTKNRMETVKDTLTQGMDSIRSSVHALYDESVDLYTEVRGVIDGFTFCPVTLDFNIEENPDKKVKYAFIAIIKEALSNTARHSGATAAAVTLRENPAFYSLVISDNGRGVSKDQESAGMGLKSIAERVDGIGGILNISGEKGFKIYISVPKGRDKI